MAANYVVSNATKENMQLAQKHMTVENAKKGYAGAKWANQKADEHGIDKWSVAKKMGAALNEKIKRTSTTQ